jgi:arylsulfatase A-like enzyme
MIALYDGEIFNADEQIGALLDDVKSLGLAEKTIIIFYADHGDMFGKHGRFMRGGPLRGTFYDDVLRIPLVIHHPRLGPRTVDELVQLLDLGPTILDLVGLAPVPGFRGKSLRPLVEGRSGGNEYVFAGSAFTPSAHNPFFQHESVIYSVRSKEWKLIFERIRFSVGPQETFELYDLKKDPEELEDIARTKPEVVTKLKQVLLEWLDDIKASEFRPQW